MGLSRVQYEMWLFDTCAGTIKPNDAKRLFKVLRRKFNRSEIETFIEKLALSAFLLHGYTLQEIRNNAKERTEFLQGELNKHEEKLSVQL